MDTQQKERWPRISSSRDSWLYSVQMLRYFDLNWTISVLLGMHDFKSGNVAHKLHTCGLWWNALLANLKSQSYDPLEAILVIFGRRALIFFFFLKALGNIWKMTPLLCECAVMITLETQKCRKRAPRSVEFNFFINCNRQKRFSQNERRRADLQNICLNFFNFCRGT